MIVILLACVIVFSSGLPFFFVVLCVCVLPFFFHRWKEKRRSPFLVALLLSLPWTICPCRWSNLSFKYVWDYALHQVPWRIDSSRYFSSCPVTREARTTCVYLSHADETCVCTCSSRLHTCRPVGVLLLFLAY
ncbi:unnamed protein product [Ectocarpus sp. 8 AP-2014]